MSIQNKTNTPKIGDIYLMNFTGCGSEQSGWRPGLVFQNNIGNRFSPNVIALPLTGVIKKTTQPTHVVIRSNDSGLMKDSMVLCENPQRLSKDKVGQYITSLSDEYMEKIAAAYLLATSAIAYLDIEILLSVWEKAIELNTAAGVGGV